MEEVKFIYRLYEHEFFSLWEIKESVEFHLDEPQIEEIACAISHAEMDIEGIPYDQRPSFYDDPSSIDPNEFRLGNPRQQYQVSYYDMLIITSYVGLVVLLLIQCYKYLLFAYLISSLFSK